MISDRSRSDDVGFTLVEIVIAIVLVGILSAVVVVGVGSLTSKGSAASCSASLDAARTAVNVHVATTAAVPTGFTDLVASGALSLPAGVTVRSAGRAIGTDTWTLVMNGTSLTCVAGNLWSPLLLGPGVAFWLDAGNVTGGDGSSVAAWPSTGSAAAAPTAAGATNRPVLVANGIGARPSIRFDGIDDVLAFDGSFLVGTEFTVAAVTAREAAFGAGYYIGGAGNGNVGTAFILGYALDTAVRYSHRNDGIQATVPTFTTVRPTLHVARSSTAGRNLWIDGAAAGSAAPLPLNTWSSPGVGRDSSGSFRGLVGEIVIVTSALSTTDREKLEGYLAWKWGTVSALSAGHPYATAPPTA